jgi:hypothetical protein
MRKHVVGLAALGLLFAVAVPSAGEAASVQKKAAVKAGEQIEVSSQYRRYRRVAYRPYRAVRAYQVYSAPAYGPAPGYYPAWYSPYYDEGYAYGYGPAYYGGYGSGYYGGYRYGYAARPLISIGFGGFGFWF